MTMTVEWDHSFFFTTTAYLFFLNSVLRPFQDYFSSYETGQSGGRKRENPEKQNLACLVCGQSGALTHTRHSGGMIE